MIMDARVVSIPRIYAAVVNNIPQVTCGFISQFVETGHAIANVDRFSSISIVRADLISDSHLSQIRQISKLVCARLNGRAISGHLIEIHVSVQNFHGRIAVLVSNMIEPPMILGMNFMDLVDIIFVEKDDPMSNNIEINTVTSSPPSLIDGSITVNSMDFDRLSSKSTSLLKIAGTIGLFEEFPISVNILVDGGSTHSFISPFALNESHKAHLVTPDTPTKQKRSFVITSATHDVSSNCTVVIASIKMQQWSNKLCGSR